MAAVTAGVVTYTEAVPAGLHARRGKDAGYICSLVIDFDNQSFQWHCRYVHFQNLLPAKQPPIKQPSRGTRPAQL